MHDTYGERDRARGVEATIAWLTEELGELARAVRKGTPAEQLHEVGDVPQFHTSALTAARADRLVE